MTPIPTAPPIPSATLILLRDTGNGIESLIMRRNTRGFLGGIWVFPGGMVDAVDAGRDQIETARNAAVRETREEAGITPGHAGLLPISLWVTPEGAPKRFSTWFFVAGADDQAVVVDGHEMTESLWISPAEAIAMYRRQEIEMLPPTLVSLIGLKRFTTVDAVLDHYHRKEPVIFTPKANFADKQLVMLYPGDSGYESLDVNAASILHRCIQTDKGWKYINETGISL